MPPLAAVIAVAATTISSSDDALLAVNLVGSIDNQGLPATWWFEYGPSPALGSSTAVKSIPGFTGSLTVSAVLPASVLTAGHEYRFALAAHTAAGSALSPATTFVASAPSSPTSVSTVTSQSVVSGVGIPHFDWPFRIKHGSAHRASAGDGGVASDDGAIVVEQDTAGDIESCVIAICSCLIGQFPEVPSFGIPDYTFTQAPLDVQGLAPVINRWENRATETTVSSMVPDGSQGDWSVGVEVQA